MMKLQLNRTSAKILLENLDYEDLQTIEMDDKNIEDLFQIEELDFFLLKNGNEEIGMIGVFPCPYVSIDNVAQTPIFIHKDYRGMGCGKLIIALIENTLRNRQYDFAAHRIRKNNEKMLKLSKSCGYILYLDDGEYIIFMKDLGV